MGLHSRTVCVFTIYNYESLEEGSDGPGARTLSSMHRNKPEGVPTGRREWRAWGPPEHALRKSTKDSLR